MDDAAQVPGSPDQNNDFDLTFLSAANATFIAEMNAAWRRDPSAVDPRWARYFEQLNTFGDVTAEIDRGPSWARNRSRIVADGVTAIMVVFCDAVEGRGFRNGQVVVATRSNAHIVSQVEI